MCDIFVCIMIESNGFFSNHSCSFHNLQSTDMLHQFMKVRSHFVVKFVNTAVSSKVTWKNMLNLFMKERTHLDVTYYLCDYSCSQKRVMTNHIASLHEGKRPFRCDICEYKCSYKSETLSGIKPPLKDQSRDITAHGCFKPALRKPSL